MTNDITNAVLGTLQSGRESIRSVGVSSVGKPEQQPAPRSGKTLPSTEEQATTKHSDLELAVKKVNDHLQSVQRDLRFSIDEDSGRTVIKVIDSETKDVIRQYPSEEMLKLAKQLSQGDGLLIRVKA